VLRAEKGASGAVNSMRGGLLQDGV
jgi:hypothetical protein